MNPLAALSGGFSSSVASKSGDASSGLNSSFNYNGAFQVGGSGTQKQEAGLAAATGPGASTSSALFWVGLVVGVLALGVGAYAVLKK